MEFYFGNWQFEIKIADIKMATLICMLLHVCTRWQIKSRLTHINGKIAKIKCRKYKVLYGILMYYLIQCCGSLLL